MGHISEDEILAEYQRLRDWAAGAEPAPGRTTTLGWDLEYPTPGVLVAFLDQILFRRVNDFLADSERPVILDCGANIGYTVLNYKRQFPHAEIVAFEPDPLFAPLLHAISNATAHMTLRWSKRPRGLSTAVRRGPWKGRTDPD